MSRYRRGAEWGDQFSIRCSPHRNPAAKLLMHTRSRPYFHPAHRSYLCTVTGSRSVAHARDAPLQCHNASLEVRQAWSKLNGPRAASAGVYSALKERPPSASDISTTSSTCKNPSHCTNYSTSRSGDHHLPGCRYNDHMRQKNRETKTSNALLISTSRWTVQRVARWLPSSFGNTKTMNGMLSVFQALRE